jgi:hypothetical protein
MSFRRVSSVVAVLFMAASIYAAAASGHKSSRSLPLSIRYAAYFPKD